MKNLTVFAKGSLVVLALACCNNVSAQSDDIREYQTYPHQYISVQGGMQSMLSSDYSLKDLAKPIGQLSYGINFNPLFGVRLAVSGYENKDGVDNTDFTFTHKYVTGGVDLMLNLSNLITGRGYSRFNAIALGGFGINYAWYDGCKDNERIDGEPILAWKEDVLSHNLRLGLQLGYDVSKHFDVTLEGGVNNMGYRMNCHRKRSDDWNAYLMLGVAYKFGHAKKKAIENVEMESPIGKYEAYNSADQTQSSTSTQITTPKKPATPATTTTVKATAPERHETNIFFALNAARITQEQTGKIDEIVSFMRQNQKAKLTVTGYADKGTGNANINRRLSKERAEQVALEVAKRGIERNRIIVDYKGDSQQPFADNDKNRVVIGIVSE